MDLSDACLEFAMVHRAFADAIAYYADLNQEMSLTSYSSSQLIKSCILSDLPVTGYSRRGIRTVRAAVNRSPGLFGGGARRGGVERQSQSTRRITAARACGGDRAADCDERDPARYFHFPKRRAAGLRCDSRKRSEAMCSRILLRISVR
ncbi:hypothetical protein EMEDMD4_920004 [Sinorhizobium medicae]|uniref:Uncharacterized protein n=1 Tax=Sinorhizobium medicae TaxID=110321 RepID=A0A508X815_9HYPH|nr:hypothetical protein EMEDMD4_920004 [Sinorhizobium medicae]